MKLMCHFNLALKYNFSTSIISSVGSYCHLRLEIIFYCCVTCHLGFLTLVLQRLEDCGASVYHLVLYARLLRVSAKLSLLRIVNFLWPPGTQAQATALFDA